MELSDELGSNQSVRHEHPKTEKKRPPTKFRTLNTLKTHKATTITNNM